MFHPDQYQLLDFGNQQKLETFSGVTIDRMTPSAIGKKHDVAIWQSADLRYVSNRNKDRWSGEIPNAWELKFGETGIQFELRTTPTGQIGIFPEQATNWNWILDAPLELEGKTAINLFGYTGGTSLALAKRGAQVTHIDAATSVVKWARRNAELSGLADAPIRWIVEDAVRFVRREIKRGRKFDIIVADPPSFGRGPSGETRKFERDIESLVNDLRQLQSEDPAMLIFSCHTPGFDDRGLQMLVERTFGTKKLPGAGERFSFKLPAAQQSRSLPSGHCFRWMKQ